MQHIRLENPETVEELHKLQHELLSTDPDDPRFLDAVPGSVEDITMQMRQKCGGTLPANMHVIGAASFEDFTQQFSKLVGEQQRQSGTDR